MGPLSRSPGANILLASTGSRVFFRVFIPTISPDLRKYRILHSIHDLMKRPPQLVQVEIRRGGRHVVDGNVERGQGAFSCGRKTKREKMAMGGGRMTGGGRERWR